jgi:hypothetical protein
MRLECAKSSLITVDQATLAEFGQAWLQNGERLRRTPPYSSSQLGKVFDDAVGYALSVMLGGIEVVTPNARSLTPSKTDCVEVGPVRIIGGIRPQNFDVGYRPDGVRFAFDSKTLNDQESIGKNWQNMVNDLATEATTVHSRFPHALVAFMVVCPMPAFSAPQQQAMTETLERLARRDSVGDPPYMAEAISLVVWNPDDGTISSNVPAQSSSLRIEKFSHQVQAIYLERYKGLPPHGGDGLETSSPEE